MYERLADLRVRIDEAELERREMASLHGWTRVTTTVVLRGGGAEGRGEDVTYTADDHEGFPDPLALGLEGDGTLDELSGRLEGARLFADEPAMEASADYRRWAFESALLDLALRQAGRSLGELVERRSQPIRFAISTGPVGDWLAVYPGAEFKIDAQKEWTEDVMQALAATGAIRTVDLKSFYRGTPVDLLFDPELYAGVARLLPDALIEDPDPGPESMAALAGAEDRLSFDAPLHSLSDLDGLPPIRHANVKPSRFGTTRRLLEFIEGCGERGIALYGGGQSELGVGRDQIQAIASLFYADGPNDIAPREYNSGAPRAGLPASPLPPPGPGPGIAP